ncbi:hypothetical protein ACJ73_00793, partial [Blastomyces percursus]
MIRLPADHPARNIDPHAIRERVRALLPDPSWISDVWHCPSGVTLATSSTSNAAHVLERSSQLQTSFGDCRVERQESWATFIVGPIKKSSQRYDGESISLVPITHDILLSELRGAIHQVPIIQCSWTRKSQESHLDEGYVRVGVQAASAHLFPNKLRLFSHPVMVNR